MSRDAASVFRMSLYRCLSGSHFMKSFYDRFVGGSEQVREKFKNTDMDRQYKMLADSLYVLAMAIEAGPATPERSALAGIAARHGPEGLDIAPELYDQWLEAIMATVAEHDPDYSPEVARVWRDMLAAGIDYMRSRG